MKTPLTCHLYTREPRLGARIAGFLDGLARVQTHPALESLAAAMDAGPGLALIDLRDRASVTFFEQANSTWPNSILVALGDPRSDPAIAVDGFAHAIVEIAADHRTLRGLIRRAIETLSLKAENASLRSDILRARGNPPSKEQRAFTSLLFGAAQRSGQKTDTVDGFLDDVVKHLVDAGAVSRAGVFSSGRNSSRYRLRAACRAMSATRHCEYAPQDAIIRWMTINAHMFSLNNLDQLDDPSERNLLRGALASWGAEAAVPLHSHERLLGWLFIGRRTTGEAFTASDLGDLVTFAAQVASGLERALLHEEILVRQILMDTLLRSLPTGIVAAGTDGLVHYFNSAASKLLDLPKEPQMACPVSQFGSKIADLIHRALRDGIPAAADHGDASAGRAFRVRAFPLLSDGTPLGAVALIEDVTAERIADERDRETERAQVWSDLANGLSQEIRNSLVAFSVYTQLLPERSREDEFLAEFTRVVPREVDRLTRMVEKISSFANLAFEQRESVSAHDIVSGAVELARRATDGSPTRVTLDVAEDAQPLACNRGAMIDCLGHAVINAIEACEGMSLAEVKVVARPTTVAGRATALTFIVSDSGPGIPDDIANRIFSPFCTTKGRGLGLGLPVIRRTVADHGGAVDIQTGAGGTTVRITIPHPTHQEIRHDKKEHSRS